MYYITIVIIVKVIRTSPPNKAIIDKNHVSCYYTQGRTLVSAHITFQK